MHQLIARSLLALGLVMLLSGCAVMTKEAVRPDIGGARDIYDGALFPDKAVRT